MRRALIDTEATTREAALACIAAGVYPTRVALRKAGALGDWANIGRAFRNLLDRREIVLPDLMASRRNSCSRIEGQHRGPAPIPVPCPRPVELDPSPCAVHIRDYRAHWRHLHASPPKPRTQEVTP